MDNYTYIGKNSISSRVKLFNPDPRHLELLLSGIDSWNRRRDKEDFKPNLMGARIYEEFQKADKLEDGYIPLYYANLKDALLAKADLRRANLESASLQGTNLFNEILGRDDLKREFVRQSVPLKTIDDYRRAELRTSPFIVAQALLAEPLRLYKQITSDRPELKREEIEQRVRGEVLATLLRLRNVVFHVPDDRTDLLKAESNFLRKASAMGDYREIFGGLWRFYIPDLTEHKE